MWWVINRLTFFVDCLVHLLTFYIFLFKKKKTGMLSVKVYLTSYLIPALLLSIISPRAPCLIYDFTLLWEGQEELGFTSPSLNHSRPEFLFLFVVLCHVYLYASDFHWTTLNFQWMYKIHGDILQNIFHHFLYNTLWIFESMWLTIHYYAQNGNNNTILILISLYIQ